MKHRIWLRYHVGRYETYIGTFVCFSTGKNKGRKIDTLLLKNIQDSKGYLAAGHLWLSEELTMFQKLNITGGERIGFTARAKAYQRGDGSIDYTLCDFKNVRIRRM